MRRNHTEENQSKEIVYEELEAFARAKIRDHLQYLLEQEVTRLAGAGEERAQAKRFGAGGIPQRLRQAAAVHDEWRDH